MNQALKQMPNLRDRIVEVLRDHHEVKHIGALADKLEEALEEIGIVDLLAAAPAKQEARYDLGQLEIRMRELIAEKPTWARQAAIDDHTRMWFVSELISHASGRVPLLEIEGLVSRQLAAMQGGGA